MSSHRWSQDPSSVQPVEPVSGQAQHAADVDQSMIGLTAAEAAARTPGIDLDAARKKERRSFIRRAIYKNLFTLFNFDLIAMMVMLYLLGSTLGALGSLLVLIIAVVLNTLQEVYTKSKLDEMLKNIQPQVTVIRDGHIQSIDRWQVVEEDLLIVRRGDQIMVNGMVVSESSLIVEETAAEDQQSQQVRKKVGDRLIAGGYCIAGHGTYQSQEMEHQYLEVESEKKIKLFHEEPTPLQRMMRVVFLGLLGFVILFSLLLLLDAIIQNHQLVSDAYRDGFSIIMAVGPTSLFMVLIVQYAVGTLRFMDNGALIYESIMIESLSNVSLVCFDEQCLYGQLQVRFEPIPSPVDEHYLSETLIQHLLGDILHSLPINTARGYTLVETFPGSKYQYLETVPLLNTIGWYGVTFNETNLRGTFIIGKSDVLEDSLLQEKKTLSEQADGAISKASHGLQRWLSRVVRREPGEGDAPGEDESNQDASIVEQDLEQKKGSFLRERVAPTLLGLLETIEEKDEGITVVEWQGEETLTFAYLPEPVRLYGQNNQPQLPNGLLPLSYIHVSNVIRPELSQVLKELDEDGIAVKVLSSAPTERAIATAHKLGLGEEIIKSITGEELSALNLEDYTKTVKAYNVLGSLTPTQKELIVKTLRQGGDYVAMVGNDIDDILAMQQAQISVAMRSADPAVLKQTDIVLLEDSLHVLPRLLFLGQRMVNGAVDTFKLYLSQVGAQLFLLLYMLIFNLDAFPYHPTQGGVINAFAIVIPNLFIPIWAAGGRLDLNAIRRRMIHFIVPTAVLLSILGAIVYILFLRLDFGPHFPPAELVKQLKITDPQVFFAQQAVVYAFLFAGWLRIFFLQPPTKFWVGGAPLRGDRRVIGLVIASILVFIVVLIFPWLPLQEWLRTTWLPSLKDYLIIAGLVLVWAVLLRTVWRTILKLVIKFNGTKIF
ncbi:MAG: HAD family hydrolase [Anaerolineales bacterium]|nr:HAD family hydrolase [Anaerolineales bacterium]